MARIVISNPTVPPRLAIAIMLIFCCCFFVGFSWAMRLVVVALSIRKRGVVFVGCVLVDCGDVIKRVVLVRMRECVLVAWRVVAVVERLFVVE